MSLANQIQTLILERMREQTQTLVATGAGMSEGAVSKWKANDLEPTARLLAAMGLTVVPVQMVPPAPAYVESLEILARMHLDHIQEERNRRGGRS